MRVRVRVVRQLDHIIGLLSPPPSLSSLSNLFIQLCMFFSLIIFIVDEVGRVCRSPAPKKAKKTSTEAATEDDEVDEIRLWKLKPSSLPFSPSTSTWPPCSSGSTLVSTPPTSGRSHRCTRPRRRVARSCARCSWLTAQTPPSPTRRASRPWIWSRYDSRGRRVPHF